MSSEKYTKIMTARAETREKRKSQRCRVFELKVKKKSLKPEQKEHLNMMFVESKWCYNYLLALMNAKQIDIFDYKQKDLVDITHKDKDGNDVQIHLNYLTSSYRLSLIEKMRSQLKTLRSLKKKGKKVGRMKFKSQYNSINFKQLGITHKFIGNSRIQIQGVKRPITVSGLDQFDRYGSEYEITTMNLVKRDDDFYFYVSVFYNEPKERKIYKNEKIGIDFGCETSLTLSDGTKINALVEETEKLKSLKRRRSKTTKFSNNYRRLTKKIHKEYRRISNIKNDKANKIVKKLLDENELIVIQDEQLQSWKKKHGKKVQRGILGRVKSNLVRHPEQVVVMNRFVPTTKFCRDCGNNHKDIQLYDRTFVCPVCGAVYDRDVHAAQNMVWLYDNMKNYIGLGKSEFKRVEFDEEVTRIFAQWDSRTMKHEDATPLA